MRQLIFCTALLFAATAGAVMANPVTCSYGDLSRKIEVVYSNPGQPVPCEVIYDKSAEGTMETLWRANNEAGYCEAQAAGLIEKLQGMGWRCDAELPAETNSEG
jgi:hypothetical protein